MSVCVCHDGVQYVFQNTENEDPRMFYERCMFKAKNMNVYSNKDELEAMSHLWVQKKYLQVEYSQDVEVKLQGTVPIYASVA